VSERLSRLTYNNHGEWKPINVKGLKISHIFYVEDVVFFGKAELEPLNFILHTVDDFSSKSGLNTNKNKSIIIFPKTRGGQ